MILRTVENALKNVYLEVLSNEIRTRTSPFFSKILTTLKDVWGKEILFTSIEENYKTYKTPVRAEPICVASLILWLSPPLRVAAYL